MLVYQQNFLQFILSRPISGVIQAIKVSNTNFTALTLDSLPYLDFEMNSSPGSAVTLNSVNATASSMTDFIRVNGAVSVVA